MNAETASGEGIILVLDAPGGLESARRTFSFAGAVVAAGGDGVCAARARVTDTFFPLLPRGFSEDLDAELARPRLDAGLRLAETFSGASGTRVYFDLRPEDDSTGVVETPDMLWRAREPGPVDVS